MLTSIIQFNIFLIHGTVKARLGTCYQWKGYLHLLVATFPPNGVILVKAGKHIGIKKVVKQLSEGPLQGILGYTEDPVVF